MLRNFIIAYIFFMTTTSYGMDETEEFTNQEAFNTFCVQTASLSYAEINENVTFAKRSETQSEFWETKDLMGDKFFVKKRGIPLSEALRHLIDKDSQTSFACATAQCVTTWKILSAFETDEMISKLEERDESFFLPLMSYGSFLIFLRHAQRYNFGGRDIEFTLGQTPVNTQEEWKKIQQIEQCLNKLPIYMYSCKAVSQQNKILPYETIEGGVLFLPNVSGVTGVGVGENLFCVDAENGLYYGFGKLFKDGPKTLQEIGKSLEHYANQHHPGLYFKGIVPYLQELKRKGSITEVKSGCHPLQYLINSDTCLYLDLEKIKENQTTMRTYIDSLSQ